MFVAVVSKSAWHAVGEQIASQLVCVYKTLSESGQVRLAARDWRAEPLVEFNPLSDRRDPPRLRGGFPPPRAAPLGPPVRSARHAPLSPAAHRPGPPPRC